MSKWKLKEASPEQVENIAQHFAFPRSLAQVLVSRGVDTPEKVDTFFDHSLANLASPFELSNMEEACQWIVEAIEKKQKIFVHGDFDADGITSSALFSLFFEAIGYPVFTFIPNRLKENHGISEDAIDKVAKENFSLLMTCDCGSSSHKEIEKLIASGVRVIVTDHHHVGEPLPKGSLLVNPQLKSNNVSAEELSGVGVVFFTLMGLRKTLREKNYFSQHSEPNLRSFLDIVALGTIADLAPLTGMNRTLVSQGLMVMKDAPQIGIGALKNVGGLSQDQPISSEDVGFVIAPRINAAARLGHADQAFELLVCQDPVKALELAQKLSSHNQTRKKKQQAMFEVALPEIKRQLTQGYEVLVVASEEYHPGIIGLLSQKICQEFQKPTISFCIEGQKARGSARSPERVHLLRLFESVSGYLEDFGGHAQAGGCTLPTSALQDFTRDIQRAFQIQYENNEVPLKYVDGQVDLTEINELFFHHLDKLAPFGSGYPYPVFEVQAQIVGKPFEVGKNHLKCKVVDAQGRALSAIAFGKFSAWRDQLSGSKTFLVQPQRQYFQGSTQISLQLLDFV